jgi:hypothetical protein
VFLEAPFFTFKGRCFIRNFVKENNNLASSTYLLHAKVHGTENIMD